MRKIILFLLFFSINSFAETIKICAILRLNDLYHHYPKDILRGLEFAFGENKTDWKIDFKVFAHDGSMSEMDRAVERVLEYNPDIVIGGESSQMALYLNNRLNNFIFISPTASTDQLFEVNKKSFRMIQSDVEYKRALKYLIKYKKLNSIGVVHNISHPNTKKIGEDIIKDLKDLGIRYVVLPTQNGVSLKREDLKPFVDSKVDLVVAFTFETDLRNIFLNLSEKNFNPLYLGADGWGRDEDLRRSLFKNSKSKFQSFRVSYWDPKRNDHFFKNKMASFLSYLGKSPNQFHAIGYDTGILLLNTLNGLKNLKDFESKLEGKNYTNFLTTKEFRFNLDHSPKKDLFLYNFESESRPIRYIRLK